MWKKRSFLFLLLLPVLFCGCGASVTPADPGQEESADTSAADEGPAEEEVEEGLLRLGVTGDVDTMDVHKTTADYMVPLNIYERLFDIQTNDDGTTELVPGLAEDYKVSKDGRTYSFTLRDDAYFSDGTRVTASDVAFSFTRMLALEDTLQSDFADAILGAEAVMNRKTDTLKGIKVVDDTHLKITLAEPFAGYIYQLATPSCSILSEKCVTEAGDDFGIVAEKTIGSGPYMVTKYTDDLVRLERNPYYQGEDYSVKKLELYYMDPALMEEAFQNGEIDILDANNIPAYTLKKEYKAENWKDRLVTKNCVEVHFLMLNVDTFPLDDVRVRRAIQLAIDRKEILHDIYDKEGTTTDGIYPKGLNGYTEENQGWLEHDPKEAARLIKEAGLDETVRIELAANASASTTDLNTLNMIRDDLQEIGLEVSVVNYDYDSWLYLRGSGKLMAYKGKWFADYNDPDNFIYTFFGNQDKTTFRSGNYNNEEIFDRIANARTIQDQDQRLAEYADLEKILVQDEAVWVPLFSTNHLFVLGDRVESFEPYWAGWSTMDLRDVILK